MIALASDHAGYDLKEAIKKHLVENNYDIMDMGTDSRASVDYPVYAKKAAEAVASGQCDRGIVCCGTGIGVSIAANKVKGIRCALVTNEFTAEMSRRHNNSNMIAFGSRVLDVQTVIRLLDIWLNAQFEEGRHQRRVEMLDRM
ncbi:MAG: ribose 5-phosphate isomerase B [Clostridia bacterium]|nr:ribose 5-phosphate isomerase B [Clostridia bacterium]